MAEQSLKEKTAKGLFWGGFSNGIQQLLNLLFGIIITRMLDSTDYGMIGMLAIFTAVANSIQELSLIHISMVTNAKSAELHCRPLT